MLHNFVWGTQDLLRGQNEFIRSLSESLFDFDDHCFKWLGAEIFFCQRYRGSPYNVPRLVFHRLCFAGRILDLKLLIGEKDDYVIRGPGV